MDELRRVEILINGLWQVSSLSEVKKGMLFRMYEDAVSDKLFTVKDKHGKIVSEFLADDDAYLDNNYKSWTVPVDDLP